jgi:hypothetical protein
MELTADLVRRLIDRLFPADERLAATAVLQRYGSAPHEPEAARVRVAALKLSKGRLSELENLIVHARRDYRDVLAWAEYPEELVQPTWRLSEEEVRRIRGADRAQYVAWLREHAGPS